MAQHSLLRTDKEVTDIYMRHIGTIYRICFTLLRSVPDAEDAAQSVFIKMMESDIPFENPAHEKAWLITTAKNHCLDQLRHWWKKRRVDLEELPETPVWDKEEDGEVYDALMALPAKYKLVLYLFYYEGYQSSEIAELLEEKDNTIRTRLRNGRRRLKTVLEGEINEQSEIKRAL